MKAIGFDLGNTLISYDKFPLSWESLYADALQKVLEIIDNNHLDVRINSGIEILKKYNTRIHPREAEVDSDIIFSELFQSWGIPYEDNSSIAKKVFFGYFKAGALPYADTLKVLPVLKEKGIPMGILTDVAYGMDKEFVLEDLKAMHKYFDVILTSTEVGYRKPSPMGFRSLTDQLGVLLSDMIYVGDEEKDIIGSNRLGIYSIYIDRKGTGNDYGQNMTITSLEELLDII